MSSTKSTLTKKSPKTSSAKRAVAKRTSFLARKKGGTVSILTKKLATQPKDFAVVTEAMRSNLVHNVEALVGREKSDLAYWEM